MIGAYSVFIGIDIRRSTHPRHFVLMRKSKSANGRIRLPQNSQLMTRLRILRHNSQGDPIVAFGAHRLNRGGTEALVH